MEGQISREMATTRQEKGAHLEPALHVPGNQFSGMWHTVMCPIGTQVGRPAGVSKKLATTSPSNRSEVWVFRRTQAGFSLPGAAGTVKKYAKYGQQRKNRKNDPGGPEKGSDFF